MTAPSTSTAAVPPAFDEEEYEEEEVELEDEEVEDDVESEEGESIATSAVPSAHTPKKPSKAAQKQPSAAGTGKVQPSSAVKKMAMRSPAGGALSPNKNPFPTHGDWTKEELASIKITFPILTGKNETTNDLTRASRPEARYWKAPVTFNYSSYGSDTIRFNNVHIPYHTAKGYGSSFVYMELPGFAADAFASAGKVVAPTRVTEPSLAPDPNRWWKIANNVQRSFGVISNDTKKFHPKSLDTIFEATSMGITCSVVLKFHCKASTMEKEPLRPTVSRTLAIEVVRGYISATDVNVQLPVRVPRNKPTAEPIASTKDVATDSLMKRLGELGL